MTENPYAPPAEASLLVEGTGDDVTLLPDELARRTRRVVHRFGLFQFTWPFAVAYFTDALTVDWLALFIAANGRRVTRASFRRFPWTVLMCCLYPVTFIASVQNSDVTDVSDWFLSRSSPVLSLQLASAIWAVYASGFILRCYFAHQRMGRGRASTAGPLS